MDFISSEEVLFFNVFPHTLTMKICILCVHYPIEGGFDVKGRYASHTVVNLSEALVKLGHDVTIIAKGSSSLKRHEKLNGVYVNRVNCPDIPALKGFLSTLKSYLLLRPLLLG